MKIKSATAQEEIRLQILEEYEILDTMPEVAFDDLTLLASHLCSTPVALISLVDRSRTWFKSNVGFGASESPREGSFCTNAIEQNELTVIEDTLEHPGYRDSSHVRRPNGVRFYAGAPLITPSGQKIGTLCVVDLHPRKLDESQRKALEALARQVIGQMELRKQLRHAKFIQAELEKAKIDALAAKSQKAEFLAHMSHEIRSPINGIMGMTELLLTSDLDSSQLDCVRILRDTTEGMAMLLNDVLDFSKIEAGKLELEAIVFDPVQILTDMHSFFKPVANKKGLRLILDVPQLEVSKVLGDSHRLKQILTNLICNALKFTDAGTIHLQMRAKLETEKIVELEFCVKDSGIGVSPSEIDRLFQSYSQANRSTTRQFGGSGLGLKISRELCAIMKGEMWMESEVGVGSTLRFTVQFAASAEVIPVREHFTFIEAVNASKLSILVAEDNSTNQIVIRGYLSKLGYGADIVSNGAEVLTAIRKKQFDIILMDCLMPVLDGYEATKQIVAGYPKNMRPVIIALTGSARFEDRERCLSVGMDDFLAKPITLRSLQEMIVRHAAIENTLRLPEKKVA